MKNILIIVRRFIYISLFIFDKIFARRNFVFVLCYHSFSKDNWFYATDVDALTSQLERINKNYKFISAEELENFIHGKKNLRAPSVLVTIDDGYRDNLDILEVFRRFKVKPLLFVVADRENIDRSQISSNKKMLSDGEIGLLFREGWDIGSHGLTHKNLKKSDDTEIEREIGKSKKLIERIVDGKIRYFSYPKGALDKRVREVVKKYDYSLAFSLNEGIISEHADRYSIPRVGINKSLSITEFMASYSPSVIKVRYFLKILFQKYYEKYI